MYNHLNIRIAFITLPLLLPRVSLLYLQTEWVIFHGVHTWMVFEHVYSCDCFSVVSLCTFYYIFKKRCISPRVQWIFVFFMYFFGLDNMVSVTETPQWGDSSTERQTCITWKQRWSISVYMSVNTDDPHPKCVELYMIVKQNVPTGLGHFLRFWEDGASM